MRKLAEQIKTQTSPTSATQNLYRVDPPIRYSMSNKDGKYVKRLTRFILISAVNVPYSGPETYIFAANRKGEVKSWNELDGSFRGSLDHSKALKNIGYREIN